MQTTAAIIIIYGLVVLAGGLMGYRKARSTPSLIAGLAFGLALIVSGLYAWQGQRMGLIAATALAGALLVVMSFRCAKTKKFMPAGLIALLSLAAVIVFGIALGK